MRKSSRHGLYSHTDAWVLAWYLTTPTAVTPAVAFVPYGQEISEERLSRSFPWAEFSALGSGVCRSPCLRSEKALSRGSSLVMQRDHASGCQPGCQPVSNSHLLQNLTAQLKVPNSARYLKVVPLLCLGQDGPTAAVSHVQQLYIFPCSICCFTSSKAVLGVEVHSGGVHSGGIQRDPLCSLHSASVLQEICATLWSCPSPQFFLSFPLQVTFCCGARRMSFGAHMDQEFRRQTAFRNVVHPLIQLMFFSM